MKFRTPNSLEEILSGENDPLGLMADIAPAKARAPKAALPVYTRFQEIVDFREATGRTPAIDSSDLRERLLGNRLKAYQSNPAMAAQVASLDQYGLLKLTTEVTPQPEPTSKAPLPKTLDDILNNDNGLLDECDPSILQLTHVSDSQEGAGTHNLPEEIATRKPCEDFYNFEKLFIDIQRDILNRKVKTVRFKNESQLEVGDFYILNGLLCLIDSVLEEGQRDGRDNPRLRVNFENGVETNILKLSFTRALYRDSTGRRVIPDADTVANRMTGINHHDKATGCIYILASETKAPALADLKIRGKLVKIGYSSQDVEERVKNATTDPTYLEAPVRILASLDCYNLNPQKVEHLIHAFLAKQRINMTLISSKGLPYKPTEWFAVDRDTAIAVAEHIVKGDIMNYRMDNTTGRIKKIS